MNLNDTLQCLEADWRKYLGNRGHYTCRTETCLRAVRSRNSKKARYRWVLLIGRGPRRILSESEQSNIRWHVRQAKTQKEAAYLVVGFVQEPRRIIILPADAALKAKCVRSDKGGIAWDD